MSRLTIERFAHFIALLLGTAALCSALAYGLTGYQSWEPMQWRDDFRGPVLVLLHLVGVILWCMAMGAMGGTWAKQDEPVDDASLNEPTEGEVRLMQELLARRFGGFRFEDEEMREVLREFYATECD